jgi:hypothetical protein
MKTHENNKKPSGWVFNSYPWKKKKLAIELLVLQASIVQNLIFNLSSSDSPSPYRFLKFDFLYRFNSPSPYQ